MKRTISLVTAVLCGAGLAAAAGVAHATADPGPWSVVTLPVPADANVHASVTLGSGACGAPGHCVVPGSYLTKRNKTEGLVVTITDGVGTTQALPAPAEAPPDPRVVLYRAACPSSGRCVAVGNYELATGPYDGELVSQTASGWQAITAPVPAGHEGALTRLYDVTCAGGVCFAVGRMDLGGPNTAPLVERYANGSWTPTLVPNPAGLTGQFQLETVACSSSRRCVAEGTFYDPAARKWGPLIGAVWDGTAWTSSTLPRPADGLRQSNPFDPYASACAPGGTCHVLGPYPPSDKSVHTRPVDYTNDGTTWTATGFPNGNPRATQETYIYGLHCTAATACVAVGFGTGSGSYGVIATLTAAGWSVAYAPGPVSAPNAAVKPTTLGCLPDGSCTAFGYAYGAGANTGVPIAITTSGSPTTTTLPTPVDYNGIGSVRTAVYDGTRQLVTGTYSNNTSVFGALWERTV